MLSAVAILVVTFLSVTVADVLCPPDWSTDQGSCYLVGHGKEDFSGAENECSLKGGTIAKITSQRENDYVKGLLNSLFASVGETKTYITVRSRLSWTAIINGKKLFYDWVNPDWKSDLDGNEDDYCVLMSKDKNWSWVVEDCNDQHTYVCEKAPDYKKCFQGSCYKLLSNTHYFSEIQDRCKEFGGTVLEINSEAEQKNVKMFLKGEWIPYGGVWLGATDNGAEGEFRWLTTNEKIDYTNWSDGEPNNSGVGGDAENCVVLDKVNDYSWNDVVCNGYPTYRHVVCEITSTNGITG